jgi:hypothetical protein
MYKVMRQTESAFGFYSLSYNNFKKINKTFDCEPERKNTPKLREQNNKRCIDSAEGLILGRAAKNPNIQYSINALKF